MSIIKYSSPYFNILDQELYYLSVHDQDITALLCDHCPFRDSCSCPSAIFYGHYRHLIYRIVDHKLTVTVLYVQRIMGKGCGKTHSLVPSFYFPYIRFLLMDLKSILFDPDSVFFDFYDASLMRAISKAITLYKTNIDLSYNPP